MNIRTKIFHYSLKAMFTVLSTVSSSPLALLRSRSPQTPLGPQADGITSVDLMIPPAPASLFPGITTLEEVPVRLFYPVVAPEGKIPIAVYIHGGGFALGSAKDDYCDTLARKFAREGMIVVSVDYRVTLDAPFPAAMDDSLAGVLWAHSASHPFLKQHGDTSKLVVIGDSAGGFLTIVVSQAIVKGFWLIDSQSQPGLKPTKTLS